jgi:uncharacterized membrane protein (GlpM family)
MPAGSSTTGYADILIKSALGGLLIAVLLMLARLGKHVITGLLISVPAISLYTWWWVGKSDGPEKLRISLRAAMWSAIPWVIYLAVVYALAGRVPLPLALAAGVLAWLVVAALFAVILQARS